MANLWSSDPWMCWVQECEGEDWVGGDQWVGQGCSSMVEACLVFLSHAEL